MERGTNQGMLIRVLVPAPRSDGSVGYRVEERHIRLPLKRHDRRQLVERLNR